jgi:predicted DNA-binding transcriptional regulator AlpA
MSSDDEVLTVKEVSEVFQIHPSTLYWLLKHREDPELPNGR